MASKMAPDIFNQITNEFRGDTLNQLASLIGESPAKTQTAVSSVVPAILSGLANKVSTTEGANDIVDLIRKNNLSSISPEDLYRPNAANQLAATGKSIIDLGLGSRVNAALDWISSHAGISRTSAATLSGMCAPLILGLIGRRLGSSGLNASSLSTLLGAPGKYLGNLPTGLMGVLGLGGIAAEANRFVNDTGRRVATAPVHASESTGSIWKWLLPVLLAAAAIGLFAYLLSNRQTAPTIATAPVRTETVPAPAAPAAPAPVLSSTGVDLGAFMDAKLPNGVTLRVPTNGVENKFLAFIQDPSHVVDKTTWFSFDRLEFETDSAQLKPSSREQLANMAAILKAYPQVAVKVGGYTDNTGNPAPNLKLSQARATSTVNELKSLGVEASRLESEGYGEQFPVADNSTPEGRQRNRRIDIRVTKK
jgi:OOP family OmpA-OmpF porin